MLDGYPQWDYAMLKLRFVVLYPPDAALESRQTKPLVPKTILSNAMRDRVSLGIEIVELVAL